MSRPYVGLVRVNRHDGPVPPHTERSTARRLRLFRGRAPHENQQLKWLQTIPDKGYFILLRLYSPGKAFFDQTWKLDDVKKVGRQEPTRIEQQ